MDFDYFLRTVGYIVAFWSVWKVLDVAVYLLDLRRAADFMLGRTKREEDVSKSTKAMEDRIVEAVGKKMGNIEVDVSMLKSAVRELVKSEVRRMGEGIDVPKDLIPSQTPKRTHKVGSKKVDPIPLESEVPAKSQLKRPKAKNPYLFSVKAVVPDCYTIIDEPKQSIFPAEKKLSEGRTESPLRTFKKEGLIAQVNGMRSTIYPLRYAVVI